MNLPERKLNRLASYDYSQEGCYFVTLCTYNRQNLFILEHNHVIRNHDDYNEKWEYIENNPKKYLLKNQDDLISP